MIAETTEAPARRQTFGEFERCEKTTVTWLTPPWLTAALGRFDLDPCESIDQPWKHADRGFTEVDDGLAQAWPPENRVWLNPPYGKDCPKWMAALVMHGNGIALIPARTETKMFHQLVWSKADSVFFFKGRLTFHNADGSTPGNCFGAPSCLVAYGMANTAAILNAILAGKLAGRLVHL